MVLFRKREGPKGLGQRLISEVLGSKNRRALVIMELRTKEVCCDSRLNSPWGLGMVTSSSTVQTQ